MREKEKKTPIRTLHLINIVLWLDDFGICKGIGKRALCFLVPSI
jgi:hypothetical protein